MGKTICSPEVDHKTQILRQAWFPWSYCWCHHFLNVKWHCASWDSIQICQKSFWKWFWNHSFLDFLFKVQKWPTVEVLRQTSKEYCETIYSFFPHCLFCSVKTILLLAGMVGLGVYLFVLVVWFCFAWNVWCFKLSVKWVCNSYVIIVPFSSPWHTCHDKHYCLFNIKSSQMCKQTWQFLVFFFSDAYCIW